MADLGVETLRPFWVSFWLRDDRLPKFEYHGPWWVSGDRGGWAQDDDTDSEQSSICAAVMAVDEEAAKRVFVDALDDKRAPEEWRFVREREASWNPLDNISGRFAPREWMKWPWPTHRVTEGGR